MHMKKPEESGTILQLQGFSTHDGAGVRTVIFLPGCPLRCRWCANPEAFSIEPKLAVYSIKCKGCGECKRACPNSIFPPELLALTSGCEACGSCVAACPHDALAILGEKVTVEEIVRRVERDEIFFRHSGGGVTFSGGEPTVQEGFLRALTESFYRRGVSMWLETCGYFDFDDVKDILEKMEHALYDIKCMNGQLHRQLTGVDNTLILENCKRLHRLGIPLTVRIPAVKDVNFTEENLRATASFMRENLPGAGIELLPYHNFGHEKYMALGMREQLHEFSAPDKRELSAAYELFRSLGVEKVDYSGTYYRQFRRDPEAGASSS